MPDEQTITQASQDTKTLEKAAKSGVQKKQTRKVIVVSQTAEESDEDDI